MKLYLQNQYFESLIKSESQTGEHRGGKYFTRVQIGIEKDGSPRYRYFSSKEEYDKYLSGRKGRKKKDEASRKDRQSQLADKVKEEQKDSKKKQKESTERLAKPKKRKLLGKHGSKIKKSLRLYLENK